MFGHNDDNKDQAAADPAANSNGGDQPAIDTSVAISGSEPVTDDAQASGDPSWQHPGTPLDEAQPSENAISPAGGFARPTSDQSANLPEPAMPPAEDTPPAADDSTPPPPPADDSETHELVEIKQQALNELSPLIDELDQTPEERFRTLMMMIQASDNQHLVKAAYTAAHSIEDEKSRAQALLDIVNEINYFTSPHEA